jgi:cytochrome c peroxidase
VNNPPDLISTKLEALQAYQLSLNPPAPPVGSFDTAAAVRRQQVFNGPGQCAACHAGPEFTDANSRLHPPAEVVSEPEPERGAELRLAHRNQDVPHRPSPRSVAAPTVLPQRHRGDAGRRGGAV